MPDVTSTLLAMYQQIIGGSSAREQSALEAECARRVITSGLTIAAGGTFTLPGSVTIGGTLSVVNFSVTGTFTVPGLLTVGTLAVTGNTTIGGTLGVTGNTILGGTLNVTSNALVSGLLSAGGGLNVNGSATLTGTVTIGFVGTSGCSGGGTGTMEWRVVNLAAGVGNSSLVSAGNDTNQQLGMLQSFASTFTASTYQKPNSTALIGNGGGGLNLAATSPAASVEIWTNNGRRVVVNSGGSVLIGGLAAPPFSALTAIATDGTQLNPFVVQNTNATNTINFAAFLNSAAAVAGTITQTGAATVAYNTSSDQRLKTDRGVATDLAALRAVVVHDFTWTKDGRHDRGVFAQEAHALYPRAVTEGTDAVTTSGDLQQPWMTDYSKFVPDLIVGWQEHEAALATLRAVLTRLDLGVS